MATPTDLSVSKERPHISPYHLACLAAGAASNCHSITFQSLLVGISPKTRLYGPFLQSCDKTFLLHHQLMLFLTSLSNNAEIDS